MQEKINNLPPNKKKPKYLVLFGDKPIAFCYDRKKYLEEVTNVTYRTFMTFIPIKLGNIQ